MLLQESKDNLTLHKIIKGKAPQVCNPITGEYITMESWAYTIEKESLSSSCTHGITIGRERSRRRPIIAQNVEIFLMKTVPKINANTAASFLMNRFCF